MLAEYISIKYSESMDIVGYRFKYSLADTLRYVYRWRQSTAWPQALSIKYSHWTINKTGVHKLAVTWICGIWDWGRKGVTRNPLQRSERNLWESRTPCLQNSAPETIIAISDQIKLGAHSWQCNTLAVNQVQLWCMPSDHRQFWYK
jgi:hypothetical protein